MVSFEKKIVGALLLIGATLLPWTSRAQVKLAPDTLDCHVVAFNVGMVKPIAGGNNMGYEYASMGELYKYASLEFGLEWDYKFASGWLLSLQGDFWFGINDNNLARADERYPHIFYSGTNTYAWNGINGNVQPYNRGLALRPGIGYIFRVLPKNPNSGILLSLSAGSFTHRTIFNSSYENGTLPQLSGDYSKLYDHKRQGLMLTQSIGFLFMSNYSTYANFRINIEVSECWSRSARSYQIDRLIGLAGKDEATYFDLMLGLRLTWMFPFTGKTSYDYYYY